MGTAVMIWLGILAWVVLAIVLGFALARMISLRDRHGPGGTETAHSRLSRRPCSSAPRRSSSR